MKMEQCAFLVQSLPFIKLPINEKYCYEFDTFQHDFLTHKVTIYRDEAIFVSEVI